MVSRFTRSAFAVDPLKLQQRDEDVMTIEWVGRLEAVARMMIANPEAGPRRWSPYAGGLGAVSRYR